jgi:hypothetical protein
MGTTGSSFSSAELAERTVCRCAAKAVIWGMPASTSILDQDIMHEAKATPGALLHAPAGLETPDAHAESRRDLSQRLSSKQRMWSGGAGDFAPPLMSCSTEASRTTGRADNEMWSRRRGYEVK